MKTKSILKYRNIFSNIRYKYFLTSEAICVVSGSTVTPVPRIVDVVCICQS